MYILCPSLRLPPIGTSYKMIVQAVLLFTAALFYKVAANPKFRDSEPLLLWPGLGKAGLRSCKPLVTFSGTGSSTHNFVSFVFLLKDSNTVGCSP